MITRQLLRPEVVIAIDTSGSMNLPPDEAFGYSEAGLVGGDCGGNRTGTVDLCGDGMCSGLEKLSVACAADCNITTNNTATPGSIQKCSNNGASRMLILKRALQEVLPSLRGSVSFGLAGFNQSGYHQYFKATGAPTKKLSFFFHKAQLQGIGGWDSGATPPGPRTSFVWHGTTYTLLSDPAVQADASIDKDADSLYGNQADSSEQTRFRWNPGTGVGEVTSSSGKTWRYKGSYYVIDGQSINTSTSAVVAGYRGPQYTSGSDTWVYRRFTYGGWYYGDQGISWVIGGKVYLPLITSDLQTDHETQMTQLMHWFADDANGGFHGVGTTSSRQLLDSVRQHYVDRANGTGPFAGNPDPAASCRKRFVLFISDGHSDTGDPIPSAQATYDLYPLNRIKTYVIGIPGIPAAGMTELNGIATAGGTTAYSSGNETQLVQNLRNALLDALKGDYTTSAASISGQAPGGGPAALLPSTEFPSWRGHLRSFDLTLQCTSDADCTSPNPCVGTAPQKYCQLWDAGSRLTSGTWNARKIYTGFQNTAAGAPIPMFVNSGTVCLTSGSHGSCGAKGVNDVWLAATGETAPADLDAMVKWLAGSGRDWKLPPILNAVPAIVGPPPQNPAPQHLKLEAAQKDRQPLIYIPSNEGLIHAFDAKTGDEVFAFLPPHLLKKAYDLYKQNGQDPDPTKLTYVLANSPRVEDLTAKSDAANATGGWRTYLVQTDGPGSEELVVLDITNPSTCSSGTTPCTAWSTSTSPFSIAFTSRSASPSVSGSFGETWSIPALSWGANETGIMTMGSGYSSSSQGDYYNYFFKTDTLPWVDTTAVGSLAATAVRQHSGSGAEVEFAVLPNSVIVQDLGNSARSILASYQADLAGTLVRYDRGKPDVNATLLNAGVGHPFQYAPSAIYRQTSGDGSTVVAIGSGGYSDEEILINSSNLTFKSSGTEFVSRIYLLTEKDGTPATAASCAINQICTCLGASSCTNPSKRLLPVSSPLIIQNATQGDRMDAFYLFVEPPSSPCDSNMIAEGQSHLFRIALAPAATTASFVKVVTQDGTPSGMTYGGGEVVVAFSGKGDAPAGVKTASGNPLTGSTAPSGTPRIEVWREVR